MKNLTGREKGQLEKVLGFLASSVSRILDLPVKLLSWNLAPSLLYSHCYASIIYIYKKGPELIGPIEATVLPFNSSTCVKLLTLCH